MASVTRNNYVTIVTTILLIGYHRMHPLFLLFIDDKSTNTDPSYLDRELPQNRRRYSCIQIQFMLSFLKAYCN